MAIVALALTAALWFENQKRCFVIVIKINHVREASNIRGHGARSAKLSEPCSERIS